MPLLKRGDKGENVKILQGLLQAQGYFDSTIGGNFLNKTRSAVIYWQQTHLGPDGKYLDVDGIVGPNTWWSLLNPVGKAQRNFITPLIPQGIEGDRKAVLEVALNEHAAGVREMPDGSNWGDGVTKYLEGIGPAPWCCFYSWWCMHQALGYWLFGEKQGHVATVWRKARKDRISYKKAAYLPVPGDLFVMLYTNSKGNYTGSGHIGFVLSVSHDSKVFNTVEGNAGNRVKVGVRKISQSTLVGFINPYGDAGSGVLFDKVILSAEDVAKENTR